MPELPDITVYIEALQTRIVDQPLNNVRLASPFLLRSVTPALAALFGKRVQTLQRLGKRVAIGLEDEYWLVLHLMIAGRLHWQKPAAAIPKRKGLAAFDFPNGTLLLTEAGPQKRVSLHVVQGHDMLAEHNPGGLEVLDANEASFHAALTASNHTLKRALTDPRLSSGIGNAYSDEILHRAKLSPVSLTQSLSDQEITRLFLAARQTLTEWTQRLRHEAAGDFPKNVTAFHKEMAVHGRYGLPCPECNTPVQRIRYASNETNYCARCQTQGKVLADRSLSRLLIKDWPKTIDELEKNTPVIKKS